MGHGTLAPSLLSAHRAMAGRGFDWRAPRPEAVPFTPLATVPRLPEEQLSEEFWTCVCSTYAGQDLEHDRALRLGWLGQLDPTTLRFPQVEPGQLDPTTLHLPQVETGQLDPTTLHFSQVETGQLDPTLLHFSQVEPGQLDPTTLHFPQVEPGQLDPTTLHQVETGQLDPTTLHFPKVETGQLDPTTLHFPQVETGQLDPTTLHFPQVETGQLDPTTLHFPQVETGQLDPTTLHFPQVETWQLDPATWGQASPSGHRSHDSRYEDDVLRGGDGGFARGVSCQIKTCLLCFPGGLEVWWSCQKGSHPLLFGRLVGPQASPLVPFESAPAKGPWVHE